MIDHNEAPPGYVAIPHKRTGLVCGGCEYKPCTGAFSSRCSINFRKDQCEVIYKRLDRSTIIESMLADHNLTFQQAKAKLVEAIC